MKELTPQEYADLLNDKGELMPDEINNDQKITLLMAKTIKPSDGATAGMRCFFCGGTGFQSGNSQFTCPFCGGRGWK